MTNTSIYQIKVTLRNSKPPIWRRLLVASDMTLYQLHHIIQEAMGWWNAHLHQFIVGQNDYYGEADSEWGWDDRLKDEKQFTISQIAPAEKDKFIYEYDFGDDWLHIVLVEKILPSDPTQKLPFCIKGKRACPPEDVGGMWGYYGFLEALQDPDHENHAMYKEWIGGEFDPDFFDLKVINEGLREWWD
jgi:hypothetical protein